MAGLVLWSAPRSRSTAFLRSMIERGDLLALHEPLETLAFVGPVDVGTSTFGAPAELLDWLVDQPSDATVFVKETINQPVLDLMLASPRALAELKHGFLIRRPEEIAASFYALEQNMRIHDTGIEALHRLYVAVRQAAGYTPIVVDSDDLIAHPEATMAAYCAAVGLPFLPAALAWEAGERHEWSGAPRWHQDTSASTGFAAPKKSDRHGLESHHEVARFATRHRPFYNALRAQRLELSSHR